MLSEDIVKKLKERYNIHPLIFSRSLSKAKNDSDLFDILDSFPEQFPVIWSEEDNKWVNTSDFYLFQDFELE